MNSEIKVVDLGEAAALYCLGFELLRLEKTHRNEVQYAFVFVKNPPATNADNLPTAELVLQDYRRRKLAVDASSYYAATKEMKSQIHEYLTYGSKS